LTAPGASSFRCVLLDVEGTTTPISFVYGTLFPYARAHLSSFLSERRADPAVASAVRELTRSNAADLPAGAPAITNQDMVREISDYAIWLMDQDRKSPPLKLLQGLIWERGFAQGEIQSELFEDVPGSLLQWREAGLQTAIYSSGSVLAQRLVFTCTPFGDLTSFITRYFDTGAGLKRDCRSYQYIAAELRVPAGQIIFVSDIAEELEAARAAGLSTALSIRPGNQPQSNAQKYRAIASLTELFSS
jgi:enolase-phosphatase E1